MMKSVSMLLAAVVVSVSPAPTAPTHSRAIPVVTVHAKDFAYVGPTTVKSGPTTFRLVNDGKELHHLTLMKLAQGKTVADFVEALKKPGPPPAWISGVGGPNAATPGGSADATLVLDPGEYVMICFIPSPGETVPHAMKGMVGSLTVLPEKSTDAAPTGDVTVHLSDYKFAFSKPLSAGKHVINVVNDAAQVHEIVLVRLNEGKTAKDFHTFVEKDLMKSAAPGMPIGGMTFIAKGQVATFPVNLQPGNYAMICFVPDATDGKSHADHGMVMQFAVK
jgi:uncharacterized cupredoxin-like copper-binding protein